MDETKNTPALILNRQDYKENDSLVTVYTPCFGKLTLVARGTKKLSSKLAGHIEPLTLADLLIIRGKGFDYIGSAITRAAYLGIREDLNKLYYAGRAINLFNRLTKENQSDEHLFFLLVTWLEILNDFCLFTRECGELVLAFFTIKFLAELGYQPEMYRCLGCSSSISPGLNYFNLLNGGLVCAGCFEKNRLAGGGGGGAFRTELLTISDNCIKLMRFMVDNRFKSAEKLKINNKTLKEFSGLLDKFILFHF
ncbi:MAG: DNA repair protein RecO [Candidatus Falkowbacteria bacterium]|nr:DNA repair protein RecO [Candidatus Falkowbacteria bacterium]